MTKEAFLAEQADIYDRYFSEPVDPPVEPPLEPPSPYGPILAPVGADMAGISSQTRTNPLNRSEGSSIVQSNAWLTDCYAWWAAGQVTLANVDCSNILLESVGPYINMRGCPSIKLDRIKHINARYSRTYGFGIIRMKDAVGSFHASNLIWHGSQVIPNSNDAWAAVCGQGKNAGDGCADWSISRFDFRNCLMGAGSEYQNADGISLERGWINGLIENGYIENCSDAGIDLKGAGCTINQVHIKGCRQNLKLWSSGDHGRIVTEDPGVAHFIVKPFAGSDPGEAIVIDRLEVLGDPDKPLFRYEDNSGGAGHVKIVVTELVAPEGQEIYQLASNRAGMTAEVWIRGEQII